MGQRIRTIYLDHSSGTPLLPEVREAMRPYLEGVVGNPSSLHTRGRASAKALDEAREKVASLLGADASEIIFTSCGTEANHLAVKGMARAHEKKGKHIILSAIEHFSVRYAAKRLEREGFRVTHLAVDGAGKVEPEAVRSAVTPETVLISVMHANGEVGTIQPIRDIADIAREHGILFHTDAVASCGTIPTDVAALGADALTLAADQFYGPVGAAALYLRKGVKILPLLDGGGQEEGRRSGTENIVAVVGMGEAAFRARLEMPARMRRLSALRDRLMGGLLSLEGAHPNGHPTERLPGHASLSFSGVEGETLLLALDMNGIWVGNGSACNSKAMKSSHVLQAMGVPERLAQGTVVLTLGIGTEGEEVAYVLEVFPKVLENLRELTASSVPMRA